MAWGHRGQARRNASLPVDLSSDAEEAFQAGMEAPAFSELRLIGNEDPRRVGDSRYTTASAEMAAHASVDKPRSSEPAVVPSEKADPKAMSQPGNLSVVQMDDQHYSNRPAELSHRITSVVTEGRGQLRELLALLIPNQVDVQGLGRSQLTGRCVGSCSAPASDENEACSQNVAWPCWF